MERTGDILVRESHNESFILFHESFIPKVETDVNIFYIFSYLSVHCINIQKPERRKPLCMWDQPAKGWNRILPNVFRAYFPPYICYEMYWGRNFTEDSTKISGACGFTDDNGSLCARYRRIQTERVGELNDVFTDEAIWAYRLDLWADFCNSSAKDELLLLFTVQESAFTAHPVRI